VSSQKLKTGGKSKTRLEEKLLVPLNLCLSIKYQGEESQGGKSTDCHLEKILFISLHLSTN